MANSNLVIFYMNGSAPSCPEPECLSALVHQLPKALFVLMTHFPSMLLDWTNRQLLGQITPSTSK